MIGLIRKLLLLCFLVSTASEAAGSLTVSVVPAPATADLSSTGTTDWVHWGLSSPGSVNRKAGGSPQISTFKTVGGTARRYKAPAGVRVAYRWNDGAPTASANTTAGVYLLGVGNRYELSVPADTQSKTLTLYLGGYRARGQLRVSLSDGSAPPVTVTVDNQAGVIDRAVTLNFATASAGRTLQLRYTLVDEYAVGGNITLAGAALRGIAANQPPSLAPIGNKTTSAGQLLSFTVTANDADGPSPLVLDAGSLPPGAGFTDNGNGTGLFSWTPTESDVVASPYSLTFTATDENGFGSSTAETLLISVTTATGIDPVGTGNGIYPQFAQVPVLPNRMNFAWFPEAKSLYDSSQPDDPMDWSKAYKNASKIRSANSCSQLQAALNQANPGDMILVGTGDYKSCRVTISRSGTQGRPIIVTSKAKALNGSGTVVFSGGRRFAQFRNSASHYIIGGFKFIGQSYEAFELLTGGTVKNSQGGLVYKDGSVNIRLADNHYEKIGRASGSNSGVILVGVRSHRIRIDHSSFISNYNHIRFRNDSKYGALVSASKDGRVDHNYFGPAADTGFIAGVPYEIGAIQTCCATVNEKSDPLTLVFEYNVVEHKRNKHADPEIVEVKTVGMEIRNNIIWSARSSSIALRYAFASAVESNYLVGAGIAVSGSNHTIFNNYIDGLKNLKHGILMNRWGRRKPSVCNTLPPTHDNLILQNTILNTKAYGLRIGDCDYGACRPITDSLIADNYIKSDSGKLAHFNTRNEPGRKTLCKKGTTSKAHLYDKLGDASGGKNIRIDFTGNVYSKSGTAEFGSAYGLEK